MLWDEKTKIGKIKSKLILTCVSLISGLVLHLNYLILPWVREQKGELVALINFGVLAVAFSLLIMCLFKSFIVSKAKHSLRGNINLKNASQF